MLNAIHQDLLLQTRCYDMDGLIVNTENLFFAQFQKAVSLYVKVLLL
jgi:hypothetical protein